MRIPLPGLMLLLSLTLPTRAQTPDPGLLDALMAKLAAVPQRRANFTEERHFAALTTVLRSQGWLQYRRPDFLQKVTTAPQSEDLTVQGDELRINATNRAERVVSLGSEPEAAAFVDAIRGPLSGDLAALRRHYQVTASGNPAAWHLALVPSEAPVQQILHDVAIDGAGTEISAIRITQANGYTQTMTITPAQ